MTQSCWRCRQCRKNAVGLFPKSYVIKIYVIKQILNIKYANLPSDEFSLGWRSSTLKKRNSALFSSARSNNLLKDALLFEVWKKGTNSYFSTMEDDGRIVKATTSTSLTSTTSFTIVLLRMLHRYKVKKWAEDGICIFCTISSWNINHVWTYWSM